MAGTSANWIGLTTSGAWLAPAVPAAEPLSAHDVTADKTTATANTPRILILLIDYLLLIVVCQRRPKEFSKLAASVKPRQRRLPAMMDLGADVPVVDGSDFGHRGLTERCEIGGTDVLFSLRR